MSEDLSEVEQIPNEKILWIKRLAWFMDANFRIPFTKIRFGLDPLLSLVPGAGQVGTYLISIFLVWHMYRNGASGKVRLKMIGNVLLDAIISFVPVLSFFFDVAFKANNRNVRLLLEHYEEGAHKGSGWGLLLGLFLLTIAVCLAMIWGIYQLFALILTI